MNFKALFVGLTTIDIQYFTNRFPQSNTKVKTPPPDILVGGPAANAAVLFSKLNNGANLVSASGKNSFSELIRADFKTTGVEFTDLVAAQNTNPVIASVITSECGDRTILTHNPATIQPEISVKDLFNRVNPQIVLIDGFFPEFSIDCAIYAKSAGIPVVIDCGSWKTQYNALLEYVDIAICSNDFYPQNCVNTDDVIRFLQKRKVKKIAISKGAKDIVYFDNKRAGISIPKIQVVDTLGAGDFLHGAFCYFYLKTTNFEIALNEAAKVASFSCLYQGTRNWLNKF